MPLEGLLRLRSLRQAAAAMQRRLYEDVLISFHHGAVQVTANSLTPLEGLPRMRSLRLHLELPAPGSDWEVKRALAAALPKLQVCTEFSGIAVEHVSQSGCPALQGWIRRSDSWWALPLLFFLADTKSLCSTLR